MAKYFYHGAEIITPFTITSNEPLFDMTTVSLKTDRASQGYQRWELSFNVVGTKNTEADLLLSSVNNLTNVSQMVMPQLPSIDANSSYSGITNNSISHSAVNSGDTSTVLGSFSGVIPKGTFFNFDGQDKLYIATSAVDGTSNTRVLSFYPAAKSYSGTGQPVKIKGSCNFSYYINIDNQTGITYSDGVLSNLGTISLVEAV